MPTESFPEPAARVDGGALGVGTGLLMPLREAMETLPGGAVVAVRTSDPAVAHDLPAWCRLMGHAYLGDSRSRLPDGTSAAQVPSGRRDLPGPADDYPTYYFRKT